ncbi:MAG: tryptophan--tRNA ligase, partial [Candidatus Dormibacteraceae bacterium]
QSHVPAHAELAWLLECFLPMGWLDRMTQFKVKTGGERERASAGLYTYPALMAADILLYDAALVPVGDDQRQHGEITRDVAQRVNARFGPVFTIPEVAIGEWGARVMGLDDPRVKMSKSTARTAPNHAIAILDPPDIIRSKVGRAVTDGGPALREPLGAGVANLVEILSAVAGLPREAVVSQFVGLPYARLKEEVAGVLIAGLEPVQARYRGLRGEDGELLAVLAEGAESASLVAARTLARLQDAVGLVPRGGHV